MQSISSFDIDGNERLLFSFKEINECPACHFGIEPRILYSSYILSDSIGIDRSCRLYINFYCPKCHEIFLGKFKGVLEGGYHSGEVYMTLRGLFPRTVKPEEFSDNILGLSLAFVETYMQAQRAEASELNQICGIGYRKALEFLVKDYLCHKFPDEEENIKKESLGKNLNRIEDGKVQTLAKRATWIGNDETHYVRKHEDLDVGTMKTFIRAMVHFIDSDLTFEQALTIDPA